VGLTVSSQLKGTLLNWNNGGRLLAWIGDQVRLKAFSDQLKGLIYRRRHCLMLIGKTIASHKKMSYL